MKFFIYDVDFPTHVPWISQNFSPFFVDFPPRCQELVAAVARQQPWPLPPQLTEQRLRPALLRLAEAAMNALAAVWSKDVECKRLARQVAGPGGWMGWALGLGFCFGRFWDGKRLGIIWVGIERGIKRLNWELL